jgi:nicotinate-nucleotide--dimethylbenzimidazole phosphoribosyltransferase
MAAPNRSLVTPTTNPQLETALRAKLHARHEVGGSLGELEPLAIRLGLMQNSLRPHFHDPQLLVFAADHGLVVEDIRDPHGRTTNDTVRLLLANQLPVSVFARAHDLDLTVIDCGMAENLVPHDRLLVRKIAYGTRNSRVTLAMSMEQAHAGVRAGMQIGEQLRGNLTILSAVGVGAHESAAMVLSRLTGTKVRDLIVSGPQMNHEQLSHLMVVLQAAKARHRDVVEPIEVLAALGGYEVAVMVGVMLVAASKRHLLMIDGVPACAALMLASKIAQAVTDYCVFSRSHSHLGLDQALNLFRASALLEMGMESTDGTGAALAWPLVKSAAALLGDVADGEQADAAQDGDLGEPFAETAPEPFSFGTALY